MNVKLLNTNVKLLNTNMIATLLATLIFPLEGKLQPAQDGHLYKTDTFLCTEGVRLMEV